MPTFTAIATTALNTIEAVQLPVPSPAANEVVIEINYGSLMAFDLYQVDYGLFVQEYPNVIGIGGSGKVKSVGEGVEDLKEGDRVAAMTVPLSRNKSLQEYAVLPRDFIAKIPRDYALLDAATLSDNFVCAFYSLFKVLGLPIPEAYPAISAPPLAGEPFLIYGAGTSVGLYAVQLLKLAGYTNVVVTASQKNHEYLKSLGATHTIDYRSPNLAPELLRVAGGRKYKFAVDIIAARTSLGALSEVLDAEASLAVLLPVKSSDNLSDLKGNKGTAVIEPWVAELLPGVSVRPVITMEFSQDAVLRENLLPKILPELLEKGLLEANRTRLINTGTLKERVEQGLDLLRNNKVSGEKIVVEVKSE